MEENFNPNLLSEEKKPQQPNASKSIFDDFFAGLGKSDFMQRSNKLLAEGGYVEGTNKSNPWTSQEWYVYLIGAVAVIGIIILCILIPNSHYYRGRSENIYVCSWVLSIASLVFSLSQVLYVYLDNRGFKVRAANGESPGSLGTTNGIGLSLQGSFRGVGMTYVAYQFLCFFIPLIPVGCYRVSMGGTTSGYKKTTTSYRIYGSESWSGLEILQVYMSYYSIMTLIFGSIAFVISLFD